tara:strand:- start:104 stop:397 length:294 start_codon:yes stop_codon:yes gene_type:complete
VHELGLVYEGRAYYLTFSQSSTKPLLKRLAAKFGRGPEFDAFSAVLDHEAARHGSLADVQSRLRVAVSNKERDALRVVESHLRVLQFWKVTPLYGVQ